MNSLRLFLSPSLPLLCALPVLAQDQPVVQAGTQALLSWGDFDSDGLDDVLAINSQGRLTLLENLGDGGFSDATALTGLEIVQDARFGLWHDVTGDGQLDLFVGTARGACYLFVNESGVFVDMAARVGIDAVGADRTAQWLDYDRDGHLDLHLVQEEGTAFFHGVAGGNFERVPVEVVLGGSAAPFAVPAPQPGATAPTAPEANAAASNGSAHQPGGAPATGSTAQMGIGSQPAFGTFGGTVSGPFPSLAQCVLSIEDAFGSDCIQASATATLGMLYPLSEDFFVDELTGNVGIGTTSPGVKLQLGEFFTQDSDVYLEMRTIGGGAQLKQGLKLRASNPFFGFDIEHDDELTGLNVARWDIDAGAFGSSALFVDRKTGSVGLGTTTPDDELQIGTNSSPGDKYLSLRTSGGNAYKAGIKFSHFDDDNGFIIESDETGPVNGLNIQYQAGGPSPETAIYVDRIDGDVGIGTTTPTATLDVNGNANIDGTLTSSGSVGIGTDTPTGLLHVNGLIRTGSETGTSQSPDVGFEYAGMVLRRIFSNSTSAGEVVALSSNLRLERDGTNGGFRIAWDDNPLAFQVAYGTALTQGGTVIPIVEKVTATTAGSQTLYTETDVVRLELTFGSVFNTRDITEVTLVRDFGDFWWVGSVSSTFDQ